MIAFGYQLAQETTMLDTMVTYIETVSIPELTALGSVGELLLRLSVMYYTENDEVPLDQIEKIEYYYIAAYVITIILTESLRAGALAWANKLVAEAAADAAAADAVSADAAAGAATAAEARKTLTD